MKIGVASCAKLQRINPQPVWSEMLAEQLDVLLLLGDTIYLDHDQIIDPEKLRLELRDLYSNQFAESNFAALCADIKERNAVLMAIYDDHDFIGNNRYGGDHDPALRDVAREEFIHAFSPPLTGNDVYRMERLDLVDIILLDERFYRKSFDLSKDDPNAILGKTQWDWFESSIASSTAKYLVVASSTTFHLFGDESWKQYPKAFERMRKLLLQKPTGKMIVAGDVHKNALSGKNGVIEVVTSAIARKVGGTSQKNYGILTFGKDGVRVDLRSSYVNYRYDVTIKLDNWRL